MTYPQGIAITNSDLSTSYNVDSICLDDIANIPDGLDANGDSAVSVAEALVFAADEDAYTALASILDQKSQISNAQTLPFMYAFFEAAPEAALEVLKRLTHNPFFLTSSSSPLLVDRYNYRFYSSTSNAEPQTLTPDETLTLGWALCAFYPMLDYFLMVCL